MKKSKKNIVRYKKSFHMNIGIVIFSVILIYLCIYLISFASQKHIAVYEVQKGSIAQKSVYTGLILRDETVVYAENAGSVNYYIKEGDKAAKNELICSVDKSGDIAEKISAAGTQTDGLDQSSLKDIETTISNYISDNSNMTFYNVYAFKNSLDAQVQEALYLKALNSLSKETDEAVKNDTFSFQKSPSDGIVAFYTDGYEDITTDTFKDSMFDPSSYQKSNLKNNDKVTDGQALYKLCTSEDWKILVPIDDSTATEMKDQDYITVTFRQDGAVVQPAVSEKKYGKQNYLILTFNSSMVRYISERYVELELGADGITGLKIPNTSIIEKEFLAVPKEYFTTGGDDSDPGLLKVNKDGSTEFIATNQYYESETSYYINETADIQYGDTIQIPNSDDTYTINKTGSLKGVYNINKGYALFKVIDIIDENEEYSIVKTGTDYGLSLYDHIALNGNELKEGELLN